MSQDDLEYKIILIGNGMVGKTCLFRKLKTGDFLDTNISTIGVEKVSFDINITNKQNQKKKIDVSLFDTAGQEKFRAVTRQYFKGTDGVLLLYDITNRDSFENVEIWINSLSESIENTKDTKYVIILYGNKTDLIGKLGKKREVEEEEAYNICQQFNMTWGGEISIKEYSKDELMKLFEKNIQEIYDIIGERSKNNQKVKKIKKHTKKKKCCAAKLL